MRQPIWTQGRVPNGYWHTRANRVKYMNWLGRRLNFRKREHWYAITRWDFIQNNGGGLLATIFRDSPIRALRDFAPKYDWKPWLLGKTPQAYWQSRKNRRKYMQWLGQQLGFRRPHDWYSITKVDFRDHGGEGLLANHYNNSPIQAVKDYLPHVNWHEWKFTEVPQGFWHSANNRHRYMAWLGKQLRFRRTEDWYRITRRDFYENYGGTLLHAPHVKTPMSLLAEFLPDEQWQPWCFPKVPNGFWKKRRNRQDYADWLGEQLGFEDAQDWYAISGQTIREYHGGTMLNDYYKGSVVRFLKDVDPSHAWDVKRLKYGLPTNGQTTKKQYQGSKSKRHKAA